LIAALALAQASAAGAQTRLTKAEIAEAFTGKSVKFAGGSGGEAHYAADGNYTYWGRDGVWKGKYEIVDGRICVKFTNGFSRCDEIFREGSGLALVNARGNKFAITFKQ
jgi:hypothetical protein